MEDGTFEDELLAKLVAEHGLDLPHECEEDADLILKFQGNFLKLYRLALRNVDELIEHTVERPDRAARDAGRAHTRYVALKAGRGPA